MFQVKLTRSLMMVLLMAVLVLQPGRVISASAPGTMQDARKSLAETEKWFQQPTNQLIVKYKSASAGIAGALQPAASEQAQRLSAAAGVAITTVRDMSGGAQVMRMAQRLPLDQAQAVAGRIAALPEVEYAEPDALMVHTMIPNDPRYPNQWHYFTPAAGNYGINAPAAWDITTGSSSIVVGVIDTGITSHSELNGRTVPGYDFIIDTLISNDGDGRDADPSDPGDWVTEGYCDSGYPAQDSSWHGTHTAGTIGAAGNNHVGVTGINLNSKILPVRVLGKCGGYISDIADGMRWAAGLPVPGAPANANPAKVLNISLGGPGACGDTYQDAINAITAAGTTVVVAAGNSSSNVSGFRPANCNGVIAVAATDRYGDMAWYSNSGSLVDISAPGGDTWYYETDGILSTLNTGTTGPGAETYAYYQGTSMATPHVAGVVSLLYSLKPDLTPAQVLGLLQSTVTPFPSSDVYCNTSICGSGIVNAGAAVSALVSGVVVTTITADFPDPSTVGQAVTVQYTVIPFTGTGTPTGMVTMSDSVDSCTATVAAGQCTITFTTSGSKTLTAAYAGDANFNAGTSAGVAHTVNAANTTTAITAAAPEPSPVGQPLSVHYTVALVSGSLTPTGTVTVSDGTDSCTASVAAGQCALTFTSAGSKTLVATYAGNASFNGSVSAGVPHTAAPAATTISITSVLPYLSSIGQPVSVHYTVALVSGSITPSGTVTVSDGVDSCTGTVADGQCSIVFTSNGNKTLTASYSGTSSFNPSASVGVLHTVTVITYIYLPLAIR